MEMDSEDYTASIFQRSQRPNHWREKKRMMKRKGRGRIYFQKDDTSRGELQPAHAIVEVGGRPPEIENSLVKGYE